MFSRIFKITLSYRGLANVANSLEMNEILFLNMGRDLAKIFAHHFGVGGQKDHLMLALH